MKNNQIDAFSSLLLAWYEINGRDLPWRNAKNPYFIWLSEVILQQTRVQQGWAYYEKFIQLFPDIHALAQATEDEVMKAWEGLGYYSRARNLHSTAKFISNELKGEFPNTLETLLKLKGIGPYTARAIGAFAFDLELAVVDGNVYRILSRVFEDHTPINSHHAKDHFQKIADSLLHKNKASDYNSALMDLGSLVCTFKNPDCKNCPLQDICQAHQHQTWDQFPVKNPKSIRKNIYLCFFWIENEGKILVQQKMEGYWKKLWLCPYQEVSAQEWEKIDSDFKFKHVFTHRDVWIKVIENKSIKELEHPFFWLDLDFPEKSLPKPMLEILKMKLSH